MFDITFTTTTCIRPDVLDKTYSVFSKNIVDMDFRKYTIHINIDPMPENTKFSSNEVVEVARNHFGNVVYNAPKSPNFCNAIKWLWSNLETEFVFHLEDDWDLTQQIEMHRVMKEFKKKPNLYQVRLNKNPQKKSATQMYGLSPCLCKSRFCEIVAKNLDTNLNPERQLRDVLCWGLSNPSKKSVVAYPQKLAIIQDTGRQWRVKHGMSKTIDENVFVKWNFMKKIIK